MAGWTRAAALTTRFARATRFTRATRFARSWSKSSNYSIIVHSATLASGKIARTHFLGDIFWCSVFQRRFRLCMVERIQYYLAETACIFCVFCGPVLSGPLMPTSQCHPCLYILRGGDTTNWVTKHGITLRRTNPDALTYRVYIHNITVYIHHHRIANSQRLS